MVISNMGERGLNMCLQEASVKHSRANFDENIRFPF
jgi:hypothetical protein